MTFWMLIVHFSFWKEWVSCKVMFTFFYQHWSTQFNQCLYRQRKTYQRHLWAPNLSKRCFVSIFLTVNAAQSQVSFYRRFCWGGKYISTPWFKYLHKTLPYFYHQGLTTCTDWLRSNFAPKIQWTEKTYKK